MFDVAVHPHLLQEQRLVGASSKSYLILAAARPRGGFPRAPCGGFLGPRRLPLGLRSGLLSGSRGGFGRAAAFFWIRSVTVFWLASVLISACSAASSGSRSAFLLGRAVAFFGLAQWLRRYSWVGKTVVADHCWFHTCDKSCWQRFSAL